MYLYNVWFRTMVENLRLNHSVYQEISNPCAYTLYSESSLEMESENYDDEDVAEERQRLQHRRNVEDTLVGKNISKVTQGSNLVLAKC